MSYKSIQIDFNKACAQAAKLENCAQEMITLANKQIAAALTEMAANWSGESASAYFVKADIVKNNIVAAAESLHAVANRIRTQAKRTYDAELAALRLAEQRSAGSGGGAGGGRAF